MEPVDRHHHQTLCPREGEPFVAELNVAIVRNESGSIAALRIGVYNLSQSQQRVAQITQQQNMEQIRAQGTASRFPTCLFWVYD